MLENQGHILTEDIVINYKNNDRDDCLHFLTHLDTTCKDLAQFISPTAKRIYTSIFNAWFLKMNFDVKNIDVQGFDTNKSYKISFKGNKYIYSFIDSKFTTGSVALLLHGAFGTYLYTGNFCYYPSFLKSPVLLPVIEEKALTRLYLDNTYYEQPSNFLGFNELTSNVAELIKSHPMKNFYIYADKVTMDPLLADIASKLEERIYVCQSTMEIMKILGYESCFTRNSNESRIFIDKAFIKKRGFELENIAVYINRYSDSCKSFQKIEKKGNVYSFNFYCHSNHKEICELLRMLKPESMTFLFSEIDKSKLSYDFKFKYDFPRTVLFNGFSTKPSIKFDGGVNTVVNNSPRHLNKTTVIIDKATSICKNLVNERIIFSRNQDLSSLNTNDEGKNLGESKSETQNATKEYVCPLRIRKVPEINNTGLCNQLSFTLEDGVNKHAENVTCSNEIFYNSSHEIKNPDSNTSNCNAQSHLSLENYNKPQLNNSVGSNKIPNYDSAGNILIPNNTESLSSCVVRKKKDMSLVFNHRLVKEISNINMVSDGKKKTILVDRKYMGMKKPCLVTIPSNGIQKTKVNYVVENGKHFVKKKTIKLLKPKTADSNSNMKRPNALLQPHSNTLNLTKLFHGWMDNNVSSVPNNASQIHQNRIDKPEKSISVEPHNCNSDNIQLEASKKNTIGEDKNSDSLVDSINLQTEPGINHSCETSTGFQQQVNESSSNKESSDDNPAKATLEKSILNDKADNMTPCKLTNGPESETVCINSEVNNESEFFKSKSQDVIKDTSNVLTKRLSDDENGQSRKRLRSDNLTQCLLQSSCRQKKPFALKNCSVLVKKNGFERTYFYSSHHGCYLPKFWGFKKHELKTRAITITLRSLQKLLEK